MEAFSDKAGIQPNPIPFNGSAEIMLAMLDKFFQPVVYTKGADDISYADRTFKAEKTTPERLRPAKKARGRRLRATAAWLARPDAGARDLERSLVCSTMPLIANGAQPA